MFACMGGDQALCVFVWDQVLYVSGGSCTVCICMCEREKDRDEIVQFGCVCVTSGTTCEIIQIKHSVCVG